MLAKRVPTANQSTTFPSTPKPVYEKQSFDGQRPWASDSVSAGLQCDVAQTGKHRSPMVEWIPKFVHPAPQVAPQFPNRPLTVLQPLSQQCSQRANAVGPSVSQQFLSSASTASQPPTIVSQQFPNSPQSFPNSFPTVSQQFPNSPQSFPNSFPTVSQQVKAHSQQFPNSLPTAHDRFPTVSQQFPNTPKRLPRLQ